MKFLCGCELAKLIEFGYKPRIDGEGFQICPDHGVREYGYRTTDAVNKGILVDARQPK